MIEVATINKSTDKPKSPYSVYERKGIHPSCLVSMILILCIIDEKVLPLVLPVHKELEQVDFQVNHWKIEDWTALESRSHGPIFEAAGYQW